jgi:hypothetical protein
MRLLILFAAQQGLSVTPMPRGAAEVADVFRRYGDAYRQQHGCSLSTAQRRVKSGHSQGPCRDSRGRARTGARFDHRLMVWQEVQAGARCNAGFLRDLIRL